MDPTEIRRQAKRLTKDKAYIQDAYKKIIGSRDFSNIKTSAAVFMAGSPGAGKTEVAKEISRLFNPEPVRIDADDFRTQFPGYNGTNSSLFQQPATDMFKKYWIAYYIQRKTAKQSLLFFMEPSRTCGFKTT